MINTILLFPIVVGLLMIIFRRKWFDMFALNAYAILHFIITSIVCFSPISEDIITTKYFAFDDTNKIFMIVMSFVFLMVAIYNNGYAKNIEFNDKKIRRYTLMIMTFVFAMTGAILSTDLGLAWVFVEGTTLSSAYLIYFNRTKHSIEAAWKYVFICSIGIAMAFVGIILLNLSAGEVNSLHFATLYENAKLFDVFWLKLAFVFMVFGFGAKMGLAPIHFWLPDAHSEAPSPISALLSATLLNSAFLIIVRVFKLMELANTDNYARLVLMLMGFLSLFVTAVFVYHIKNYKRMLAYSSIENMGILAIGTALGGGAYFAVILHLIGHSLAKASFFLTAGNILELFGSKRTKSVKALVKHDGKTGWLWVTSFLAICAFPTSLLFISEFLMIKKMIIDGHYILCALFVLLLTIVLYGIGKVVLKMAFGKQSEEKIEIVKNNKLKVSICMYIPQIIMLIIVFVLGVYIPPILNTLINNAVVGF